MMLFIQLNDLKKIARDRRDFKFFFQESFGGSTKRTISKVFGFIETKFSSMVTICITRGSKSV